MLDINFIRENKELIKKVILDKGMKFDFERFLDVDESRRKLLAQVEDLRRERNEAAHNRDIEKGRLVKEKLDGLEDQLREIEGEFDELVLYLPNIPYEKAPIGGESENEVIKVVGDHPDFGFSPKDHLEIAKSLGILDTEAGTKASGFRGYYLVGEGAILHWAVLQYSFNKIIKSGFTPLVPPTLVHEKVLKGSGHFPFGKENIYQIANPGKLESGEEVRNPMFLTGTSEPSLLAYYMDKTFQEDELPVKVSALTHCYRSEVGDYGKDTRGIYRVHEFDKVEQVVLCKADIGESQEWFAKMLEFTEEILKDFGLSYRIIEAATGDMGAGKYRMNDIEVWMPGRDKYGEICSNSDLSDWQARRLNIRYKDKSGQNKFVYTLNSTVMPSPRIIIAILENFQQADGSVKIPEVLHSYTGFSIISPKS